jgi:hypothetical protein
VGGLRAGIIAVVGELEGVAVAVPVKVIEGVELGVSEGVGVLEGVWVGVRDAE